ncbi:MAG: heavy metal translocating P-type ATPase [Chloroflexia bacterium]
MATTSSKTENLQTEKLRLSGMDCADCAISIERSLRQMPGVASAGVNFGMATAEVSYDPSAVNRGELVKRIQDLGYHAEPASSKAASAGPLEFSIEGMDCADCAITIEKAISALPGVEKAGVNFATARLTVNELPEAQPGLENAIIKKVSEAGYRAAPTRKRELGAGVPFWRRERRVLTTAVGALAAGLAFVLSLLNVSPWVVNALFAFTIVVSGAGFARAGLLAVRTGRADMNLLMSVAAVGAALLGDWAEAATVVLLFAFGGTLQAYTLEKTRGAIRSLMDLTPATDLVRRPDRSGGLPVMHEIRVPIEEVQPGETVLVGPGERVPLDGAVVDGTSSVDQAPITGESVPVEVQPGADVFAGTINGAGMLTIRTARAANDTTLAHIIQMVEEAQARKAPSQQFVDRFSAIYTPVVIVGAVLVATIPPLLLQQPFEDWFYRALVLLVIACPCALVISTPVSIVAAIGAATRMGVLIKGGATLETLGRVRAVAFDKTGTLTEGRPRVVAVHAASGDRQKLVSLAAAVEARSEHPLARAVAHEGRVSRNGSGDAPIEAVNYKSLPGLGAQADVDGQTIYVGNARLFEELGIPPNGVSGQLEDLYKQGNTAVIVGTRSGVLGVIGLADRPRPEARSAVEGLHRAGIAEVAMLTGDNPRTAEAIAAEVGVDSFHAGLLPAGKTEAIRRIGASRGAVAMVGDGINDAPALATADVGIAMGIAGTDAALEVADVALMSDNLSRLEYVVLLSRKTLTVIKQNIAVSLGVKALALLLAILGTLPLWGAIFADMGVSLLVTLNGMRLLGYKGKSWYN